MLDEDRVLECISRSETPRRRRSRSRWRRRSRRSGFGGGDQVLFAAFGGGLTWGASVLEWRRHRSEGNGEARDARSSPARAAASAPPPPARWRPTAGRSASTTGPTPSSAEELAKSIDVAGGTAVPLAGDISDGEDAREHLPGDGGRARPSPGPGQQRGIRNDNARPSSTRSCGLASLTRTSRPRSAPPAARFGPCCAPVWANRLRRFARRAARNAGQANYAAAKAGLIGMTARSPSRSPAEASR